MDLDPNGASCHSYTEGAFLCSIEKEELALKLFWDIFPFIHFFSMIILSIVTVV